MKRSLITLVPCVILLQVTSTTLFAVAPLGTGFTFQGQVLKDGVVVEAEVGAEELLEVGDDLGVVDQPLAGGVPARHAGGAERDLPKSHVTAAAGSI